jgi:hypothetical protein
VVERDRWRQHAWVRPSHASWLVVGACFWPSPLHAQPTVSQDCKELSREDSARVETRLLASLLTADAPDVLVSIACNSGIAVVAASIGPPPTRRTITLSGVVGLEPILTLCTRAVAQLLATPDAADASASGARVDTVRAEDAVRTEDAVRANSVRASGPSVQPATPAEAVSAPPLGPRSVAAEACAVRGHQSHARADVALQTWGSQAALGAEVGLEQALGRWSYAFLAGGALPLHQPSLSEVSEWTAAGEFGWHSADSLGIRVSARLGLSLLNLDLDDGVATSSGTLKSAGFLELDLSRPIWLGRFGLAPGLGVRAYSAKRALTIEGQPQLQLSTPSARFFLTVLFRTSD